MVKIPLPRMERQKHIQEIDPLYYIIVSVELKIIVYGHLKMVGDQVLQRSASQCELGTSRSLLPSSRRPSADQKKRADLGRVS